MCERVAVWRMERGPEVSSCSSRREISYSLWVAMLVSARWRHRRHGLSGRIWEERGDRSVVESRTIGGSCGGYGWRIGSEMDRKV